MVITALRTCHELLSWEIKDEMDAERSLLSTLAHFSEEDARSNFDQAIIAATQLLSRTELVKFMLLMEACPMNLTEGLRTMTSLKTTVWSLVSDEANIALPSIVSALGAQGAMPEFLAAIVNTAAEKDEQDMFAYQAFDPLAARLRLALIAAKEPKGTLSALARGLLVMAFRGPSEGKMKKGMSEDGKNVIDQIKQALNLESGKVPGKDGLTWARLSIVFADFMAIILAVTKVTRSGYDQATMSLPPYMYFTGSPSLFTTPQWSEHKDNYLRIMKKFDTLINPGHPSTDERIEQFAQLAFNNSPFTDSSKEELQIFLEHIDEVKSDLGVEKLAELLVAGIKGNEGLFAGENLAQLSHIEYRKICQDQSRGVSKVPIKIIYRELLRECASENDSEGVAVRKVRTALIRSEANSNSIQSLKRKLFPAREFPSASGSGGPGGGGGGSQDRGGGNGNQSDRPNNGGTGPNPGTSGDKEQGDNAGGIEEADAKAGNRANDSGASSSLQMQPVIVSQTGVGSQIPVEHLTPVQSDGEDANQRRRGGAQGENVFRSADSHAFQLVEAAGPSLSNLRKRRGPAGEGLSSGPKRGFGRRLTGGVEHTQQGDFGADVTPFDGTQLGESEESGADPETARLLLKRRKASLINLEMDDITTEQIANLADLISEKRAELKLPIGTRDKALEATQFIIRAKAEFVSCRNNLDRTISKLASEGVCWVGEFRQSSAGN
eukprot:GHVU01169089.1.p1 GENE.GHVU01169089.1~~GHVU01169089.1.p1  ORF type:complete len:722 (+),score=93.89 GHVU01169089.1:118-2283(+)